jgi:hypothetical protein
VTIPVATEVMTTKETQVVAFKHYPGKHNQKTHGWRYGSISAARRSMRGANAEERATYRKRAGMPEPKKIERPEKASYDPGKKDAKLKRDSSGNLILTTPYKREFVDELKAQILASGRKWNGSSWEVKPEYAQQAENIAKKHFNVNPPAEEVSANRDQQMQDTFSKKVHSSQSYLQDRQEYIQTIVRKLGSQIDQYSYNSKSNVKYVLARDRALFKNVLNIIGKPPEKMSEVEKRSVVAAYNLLQPENKRDRRHWNFNS